MDDTPTLKLPYTLPSQAQKHVTHNAALRRLDILTQLRAKSAALIAPPETPQDGDSYLIPDAASGEWTNKAHHIAAFQDGAWAYIVPKDGWRAWVEDIGALYVFDVSGRTALSTEAAIKALQNVDFVGINTAADSTNRLSIKSEASLFDHIGAGHQLKINKAASASTAALLLQSGYSGRAELGLIGDDAFSLKVSADGQDWNSALYVNNASGEVTLPQSPYVRNLAFNMFEDGGRFAGSPESTSITIGPFAASSFLYPYNGANFLEGDKFTHNNATFGGTGEALSPDMEALISKIKSSPEARRYGPEFYTLSITAGSGTILQSVDGGVARAPALANRPGVIPALNTRGFYVRAVTGSLVTHMQPNLQDCYIDGTYAAERVIITPADGWKHVVFVVKQAASEHPNYESLLFRILSEPDATFKIALPFLLPGSCVPVQGYLEGRIPSATVWR